jgi:hypothetical protein
VAFDSILARSHADLRALLAGKEIRRLNFGRRDSPVLRKIHEILWEVRAVARAAEGREIGVRCSRSRYQLANSFVPPCWSSSLTTLSKVPSIERALPAGCMHGTFAFGSSDKNLPFPEQYLHSASNARRVYDRTRKSPFAYNSD